MLSSVTVCRSAALHSITVTSNALEKPESLTSLSLQCKVFSDLGGCPRLKALVLDACESVRTLIGECLKFLASTVLQKQESLTSLSLQCKNLLEVDLSDCELLTNSICEVFSYVGGCPRLKALVLDACEGTIFSDGKSKCYVDFPITDSTKDGVCWGLQFDLRGSDIIWHHFPLRSGLTYLLFNRDTTWDCQWATSA